MASGFYGICRALVVLSFFVLFAGCAANGTHEKDPYESYNRQVFRFNDVLDRKILKPVAKTYDKRVPKPVDRSVGNFFSNLGDLPGAVNAVLQAKPKKAGKDSARFLINSTVGVLGLFDVASRWSIDSGNEDFGQTLERWGVGSGPYIVWPFLGGRTVRDTARLGVDSFFSPLQYVDEISIPERLALRAVQVVDIRAGLLDAESLLKGDRYTLVREAYLQQRELLVNDGVVKDNFGGDAFEDDIFDE